jgi:hypothetical protein
MGCILTHTFYHGESTAVLIGIAALGVVSLLSNAPAATAHTKRARAPGRGDAATERS